MAQVVWFKRDLRWTDHAPLAAAAERGPVVALYVYEAVALAQPTSNGAHLRFIEACLTELDAALRARGGWLVRRIEGPDGVPGVLDAIHRTVGVDALWSHEETGLLATWARDKAVARWCRARGVPWTELPQTGVVRRLPDRDGWAKRWAGRMDAPVVPAPSRVVAAAVDAGRTPTVLDLRQAGVAVPEDTLGEAQPGGRAAADDTLRSFLTVRGVDYTRAMSTPVDGWEACSRVSPYLAFGALSVREAHHAALARLADLRARKAAKEPVDPRWSRSIASFEARLRWHCHFMQKQEDAPELERRNLHRGYDGLREPEFDERHFAAWRDGRTGYPMVDACMRAVRATGWLNFRMRAMLVSFAAYDLWLHWERPAEFLGRQFLDFEPGIHYAQFQMQSGVTGINTLRIYSPTRQAIDQDPTGVFIRRWVPELARVPTPRLAEPWTMAPIEQRDADCRIGVDYPAPIVDHAAATAASRQRMMSVRRREDVRQEAAAVVEKHGSRKRPLPRGRGRGRTGGGQLGLFAPEDADGQLGLFAEGEG